MLSVHYQRTLPVLARSTRTLLLRDRWKIVRYKSSPTMLELVVKRHGKKLTMLLLRRTNTTSVIIVTKGDARSGK